MLCCAVLSSGWLPGMSPVWPALRPHAADPAPGALPTSRRAMLSLLCWLTLPVPLAACPPSQVCHLDSGVRLDHPDLKGHIIGGWNLVPEIQASN